ncbi:hypothetical protein ANRL4_03258 [Anaerolineae bacterium]|nr:hypothetical protein ANRL4_03258 [Anaerolineae bacterium]
MMTLILFRLVPPQHAHDQTEQICAAAVKNPLLWLPKLPESW